MTTSKIIEKIVNDQIIDYFNSNKLFSKFQFGFRSKHNTQDANNLLLETIYTHLNSKSNVAVIFIDLKKAYDSINIDLLIKKLQHYKLDPTSLKWFNSYLRNRTQSVVIGDHISDPLSTTVGIPQGLVLGLTLFNIFINDFEFSHKALSIQYADDTSLIIENKNFNELESSANQNLSSNALWLAANCLSLNVLKTFYMLFTNKKATQLNINIDGTVIERVKEFKSLGLLIDENLNFKANCQKVNNKLSKANYILNKNKSFLNLKSKMLLYNSLAAPHILYNSAIWGSAPECHLKKVQIAQNKIIRNIIYNPLSSTKDKFKFLGILNVSQIHEHQCICYIFKMNNNMCPELIIQSVENNQFYHQYNTRNKALKRPQFLLAISQRAISYKGITFWNSLPIEIREKNCPVSAFSNLIKNHLLDRIN